MYPGQFLIRFCSNPGPDDYAEMQHFINQSIIDAKIIDSCNYFQGHIYIFINNSMAPWNFRRSWYLDLIMRGPNFPR
jgi:hypothetical protein